MDWKRDETGRWVSHIVTAVGVGGQPPQGVVLAFEYLTDTSGQNLEARESRLLLLTRSKAIEFAKQVLAHVGETGGIPFPEGSA